MDQATAKQQVVERLKQANNILVTVSNNPSVDQLSACIGMTLFLNKIDKHATAVFSGKIPNVIEFLQPEKTLEQTTDSLRDFIISLDKSKADKLRYKVEDKFVRIYITPYRTSISQNDLIFSEGDFNVDVVLALGVRDRTQLDAAITAHGRILHDATVVSVNVGQDKAPDLGQINWQEPSASSLCEMLVSISEAFGTSLIDNQMATAFLTGIVAETERFSNPKTSPKVMTMAAQLMAAGANQQLIVSKLEPPPPPPETAKPVKPKKPTPPAGKTPSDTLTISHDEGQPQQESGEIEIQPGEIHIDEEGNIIAPEQLKEKTLKTAAAPPPAPKPTAVKLPVEPPPPPKKLATPPKTKPLKVVIPPPPEPSLKQLISGPPIVKEQPESPHTKPMISYPEPLNAEDRPEIKPIPRPHELLDPTNHKPAISAPFTADTQPMWFDSENSGPLDLLSEESDRPLEPFEQSSLNHGVSSNHEKTIKPPSLSVPTPTSSLPPSSSRDSKSNDKVDSVRNAVDAALANAPFNPATEEPTAALGSQYLSDNLHPSNKPAPPPVPPPLPQAGQPLKLDSGVLVPTTSNSAPVAENKNEFTFNLPKPL